MDVVDDTNAATFSGAIARPSQFSYAACASHDIAGLGVFGQISDQCSVVGIADELANFPRELRRFGYGLHLLRVIQGITFGHSGIN